MRTASSVTVTANGDLFPVLNEAASLGIGRTNPLDLTGHFRLDKAIFGIYVNNQAVASADYVPPFPGLFALDPWDGRFISTAFSPSWTNAGGRGINRLVAEMIVTQVPEPVTMSLLALAVAGFAARRRRER